MQYSEQEQQCRQKLEELHKMGINPYPADLVEVTHTSTYMLENFYCDADALKDISFAVASSASVIWAKRLLQCCRTALVKFSCTSSVMKFVR